MPMKSDDVPHFEAAVLDDDPMPWSAPKITGLIAALAETGLCPGSEPDAAQWTSAAEQKFQGESGRYALALGESGPWRWSTP